MAQFRVVASEAPAIDQVMSLTIDDALALAMAEAKEGRIPESLYNDLSAKLSEDESQAFTLALAAQGVSIATEGVQVPTFSTGPVKAPNVERMVARYNRVASMAYHITDLIIKLQGQALPTDAPPLEEEAKEQEKVVTQYKVDPAKPEQPKKVEPPRKPIHNYMEHVPEDDTNYAEGIPKGQAVEGHKYKHKNPIPPPRKLDTPISPGYRKRVKNQLNEADHARTKTPAPTKTPQLAIGATIRHTNGTKAIVLEAYKHVVTAYADSSIFLIPTSELGAWEVSA